MFVRTLFIGLALFAVGSSTAVAQCGSLRRVAPVPLAGRITPIIPNSPGEMLVSSPPSLNDLARQASDHVESRYQSCESHRAVNQHWAAKQRQPSRGSSSAAAATPVKHWTDEELAASKFQGARGLWQAGKAEAARRWLEVVLRDYAHTTTAERARVALSKL